MRRLSPDAATEVAKRLLGLDWSWTADDVDRAVRAAGLVVREPRDETSVPIEHPELPSVVGFVALLSDETTVLEVSVTLTEIVDESDSAARDALDAASKEYTDRLTGEFGTPDEHPTAKEAKWEVGDDLLEIRHMDIAVALVLTHKASRVRRDHG